MPVVVDYFFEAGCPDCERVKQQVMPELESRFEGFYRLNGYDVGAKSNVVVLIAYQEKLGIASNEPVCMVVDYKHVLNGFDAIKKGLFDCVDKGVSERLAPAWQPPTPITVSRQDAARIAGERVRGFTPIAVAAAGLLDGINPCAVSTLVFFMSLLAVSGVRGRGLLAVGASFCLASFLTYTALGFGLLRVLHLLSGFLLVRFVIEAAMMVLLALFAYLSFRDAYRYRLSADPHDISLQLPESMKLWIHRMMRSEIRDQTSEVRGEVARLWPHCSGEVSVARLAVGGLMIGAVVTAFESVCTGQVYMPTLVLVARSIGASGGLPARAWSYLLLYNLMFILPLVTVFALVYFGLKTQTLLAWSKRNVVLSKLLLGIFFLAMAGFIASLFLT